jgi:Fuc2NAc and GlcNAc transferase
MTVAIVVLLVAAGTALLSEVLRRLALRANVLDLPNERSSHAVATPRGGGVAMVIATFVGAGIFWGRGQIETWVLLGLCGPGAAIAILGLIDDVVHLQALPRLVVQAAACAAGLLSLPDGALTGVSSGNWPALAAGAFFLLALIWAVNLYNFMDGIDGLAAVEAVFVGSALLGLASLAGDHRAGLLAAAVAASGAGFLALNWPPARLFMGDSGSGFLGYALAYSALAGLTSGVSIWAVVIVVGVFVTDATVTLLVRVVRGEKAYQAHRTHAYQHLASRWNSHRTVTILVTTINCLWLAPLAIYAQLHAESGLLVAAVAYAPLFSGAILAGAGRPTI